MLGEFSNSSTVWLITIGAVALIFIGVLLVIFTDGDARERRLLKQAHSIQGQFDVNRRQAVERAARIEKRLLGQARREAGEDWRANPYPWLPGGSIRFDIFAMCQAVLGADEHQRDDQAEARKRIDRLKSYLPGEADRGRLLAPYYIWTQQFSPEAVQACVSGMRMDGAADDWGRRCVEHLRRFCAPQPDLHEDEILAMLTTCQLVQRSLPNERWPRIHEAENWITLKQFDNASRVYSAWLKDHPDDWQARIGLAEAFLGRKLTASALAEAQLLREQASRQPECAVPVARLLLRLEQSREAEQILTSVEQESIDTASQVQVLRGKRLWAEGDREQAIALWRQAVETQPDDQEASVLLAEALSSRGDEKGALAVLSRFESLKDTSPELLFALASSHHNARQNGPAIERLRQCLRRGYRRRDVATLLCRALADEKQYAEIPAVLAQLDDVQGPIAADLEFYQGVAAMGCQDFLSAQRHFMKSHQLARAGGRVSLASLAAKNVFAACYRLSSDLIARGEYARSIRSLEYLRKNLPLDHAHCGAVRRALAECYARVAIDSLAAASSAGRIAAIAALRQSLEVVESPQLRFLLAGLLAADANYAEAIDCYEQISRVQPPNDVIRFARALCELRLGRDAPSRSVLEDLSVSSREVGLRAALAVAEIQQRGGESKAAAATLVTAARNAPRRTDAYYGAVCCRAVLLLLENGDTDAAHGLARELFQGASQTSELIIGALLTQAKAWEDAASHLESAAAAAPSAAWARAFLPGVYGQALRGRCARHEYNAANRLSQRAKQVLGSSVFDAIQGLTYLAGLSNGKPVTVDSVTLQHLETVSHNCNHQEPLVVRSVLAANLFWANELAKRGSHSESLGFWTRGVQFWEGMRGNHLFWDSYIAAYNVGSDKYQLEQDAVELEIELRLRLGGFLVRMAAALLEGRIHCDIAEPKAREPLGAQFDAALNYWNLAKRLLGGERALEVFDKSFDHIQVLVSPRYRDKKLDQYTIARFLRDHISGRDDHAKLVRELALGVALDALLQPNIPMFMEYFAIGKDAMPNLGAIYYMIQEFGHVRTGAVVQLFLEDVRGKTLVAKNRDRAALLILIMVGQFASRRDSVPEFFTKQFIRADFSRMLGEHLAKELG